MTKALKAVLGAASALLAACTLVSAANATGGDPDPSVVRTDQGAVRGTVTDSARTFHRIPYTTTVTWRDVKDATTAADGGECRCLTVTTPRGVSVGAGKPVRVLLDDTRAEAAHNTARDAVVVAVGHRELGDQQTALRWVKRNAKAFGGDPSDVTLIGKPADDPHTGICAQLASPDSAYLFEHAIVRGEPCHNGAAATGTATTDTTDTAEAAEAAEAAGTAETAESSKTPEAAETDPTETADATARGSATEPPPSPSR